MMSGCIRPSFSSWTSNEVVFLWERHLAAMIVAGSHSHKGDTSLPIERRSAPYPADKVIEDDGLSSLISASEASPFLSP
jgi:hypothetical protein